MIRISQLRLPVNHTAKDLEQAIERTLKGQPYVTWKIVKQSLDARKRQNIPVYQYEIDVLVKGKEEKILKQLKNKKLSRVTKKEYEFPWRANHKPEQPPVIIGTGPAGLFCGLMLARAGFCPILIERGEQAQKRKETVESFWKEGKLNPSSNVQFGEGGAGTFSDGKLNTLVKDKFLRNKKVLEEFVSHGAPEEILWLAKPHIGTDLLIHVVENIRNEIVSLGGCVYFEKQLTDLKIEDGQIKSIVLQSKEEKEELPIRQLVLAPGHSARDTFQMLYERGIAMERKSFAVGVRVEHLRERINEAQYGPDWEKYSLPTASYKLTFEASDQRGVYSFCMCPGGYVVNASSEEGRLAINGMSNHDRMARNSNAALVVTVTPEDYGGIGPLSGMEFQRKLEEKAYKLCDGKIPVQRYGDFKKKRISTAFGSVKPSMKGVYDFGDLHQCLPSYISKAILEAMESFGRKIAGYDDPDSLLSGIESRTSSPIRIPRDEEFESNIKGIYPCGEGAGYAGGITSAAMDGIKTAEKVAQHLCSQ
ncbi:MAG: FAD-dependent oxidoreductase [Lachnospiraceae bacterium]|nr:FAD-dependent oxidoreductase [Lachnospiraceae bacterium]